VRRPSSSFWNTVLASGALAATLYGQTALAGEPPAATPASGAPAAKKSAGKDEPPPAEMVLCRSPRGAVFARDAKVGCKFGARLDPSNLVDFGGSGGAGGCSLHPIRGSAADCDAVCRAADPGSSCVVGVIRSADGSWTSFSREAPIGEAATAARQIVCCRSQAPPPK
jgi:hypothetical protein